MEIPLEIEDNVYSQKTVDKWVDVWNQICTMAYQGKNLQEKIVTFPSYIFINGCQISDNKHSYRYSFNFPENYYSITLDNVWKQYSEYYGPENPKIIPELKEVFVPQPLFESLGVLPWFRYTFPNCKITYWEN